MVSMLLNFVLVIMSLGALVIALQTTVAVVNGFKPWVVEIVDVLREERLLAR